jgi:hypothetical protein
MSTGNELIEEILNAHDATDSQNAWQTNAKVLAADAVQNLLNRNDGMGAYGSNGAYTHKLSQDISEARTEEIQRRLVSHFTGRTIGGIHANSASDADGKWYARFGCIDVDLKQSHPYKTVRRQRNHEYALLIQQYLADRGIPSVIEDSNGRGAYHIWLRLSDRIEVARLFAFLQSLVEDAEEHGFESQFQQVDAFDDLLFLPNGKPAFASDLPETFPKQDTPTGDGFGNWIRLPGKHHTYDHWSRIWGDGEWLSIEDSVDAWLSLPAADVALIPELPAEEPEAAPVAPAKAATQVTARDHESIGDLAERTIEAESWTTILQGAGWKLHSENGAESKWTRPGKNAGVSATLNFNGNNLLTVFTTSVSGLEEKQSYGKWRFYCWSNGFETRQVEAAKALLPANTVDDHERNSREVYLAAKGKANLPEAKNATPRIDFEIMDSRAFSEADFRVTWAIQNVMAENQPQLYSGPSKTLKTSILVDQVLSLAAAVPFLGRFAVPKAKRVLLLSSESGTATLQETARRICDTKGIDLGELGDQLHWGFRPPQLTDAQHIATLTDFILKNKIDVLGIDPAYLSMNLHGNEAANQFAVGAVLMSLTTLQAETGCTPILASHMRMHMQAGVMPTLDHIAGAGFGQWARQWVLLNRREEFNPDEPGMHRLLFAFGGSAGHCGAYGLDIEEGRAADGRFWKVDLNSLSQIREERETEKEERKRDKEQRIYESRRFAVLCAVKRFPEGETKTVIRQEAGLNSDNFQPVWTNLLTAMEVESVQFTRGGKMKDKTPKMIDGFRWVSPESRLENTETHENTQEHLAPLFSL